MVFHANILDVTMDDFGMLRCFSADVVFVVSGCFMINFEMLQEMFRMLRYFDV